MENVNNEILTEEIMVENLGELEFDQDLIEEVRERSAGKLALATVIVGGVIAGGYGLKKLWDKRKAKRTSSETIVTVEDFEDVIKEYDEE